MLSECVVRHQQVSSGQVREHAVRPVEHRRFHEHEFVRPEADLVAGATALHFQPAWKCPSMLSARAWR